MASPSKQAYAGPAFLSHGFRPFFLAGACLSTLAMGVWLLFYEGWIAVETAFAPRDWHAHEMLFGYVAAIIAGFLFTAIPNWTGRLPVRGRPLLLLLLLWLAGRGAVAWSAQVGWMAAAIIDSAFLMAVAAVVAREIVGGRNWPNLKVLAPVLVLALANICFHAEARLYGGADYSQRLGVAAVLILIILIGGRIVPSFTRNWLSRQTVGRMPQPFTSFDTAATSVGIAALLGWILAPEHMATAAALFLAAVLHGVRLARWAGERTVDARIVLILHLAYAFVPLGFALAGLAALALIPATAAVHAWTAGAFGSMTLAVMTRATLGHTGRALIAGHGTQIIYAAVLLAACARIVGALVPEATTALLHFAAVCWMLAFGGFAVLYGPILFRPRQP